MFGILGEIYKFLQNQDASGIFAAELGLALEKSQLYHKIEQLSITDPLTQLANRRKINEIMKYEIERSKRYGAPLSVCMFDIDFFKKFNDTYGHDAGDLILKTVAMILKRAGRTTDLAGRFGGEEFIAILPETPESSAIIYADRVRVAVEAFGKKHQERMPLLRRVAALPCVYREALTWRRTYCVLRRYRDVQRVH